MLNHGEPPVPSGWPNAGYHFTAVLPLVSWRERIVSGRDGVAVPDGPIRTVNDDFATTGVADDLTSSIDPLGLRVGVRACSIRARLDDVPPSVGIRNHVTFVPSHCVVPPRAGPSDLQSTLGLTTDTP